MMDKIAWFKKYVSGQVKARAPIQSLWIGESLSVMENASIQSYLNHGYDFHLYTYGEIRNAPPGTKIFDANEIVDRSQIFKYRDYDSYAGFSNLFRYTLLFKKGGCWTDLDMFCLRPLKLSSNYLFAGDASNREPETWFGSSRNPDVTSGFIKASAGNDFCRRAIEFCQAQDVSTLLWGITGPELCARLVSEMGLRRYVAPFRAFCPIHHLNWADLISEDQKIQQRLRSELSSTKVYAVHLWNEMWRRAGVDKNQSFHPDSLFEQLKRDIFSTRQRQDNSKRTVPSPNDIPFVSRRTR